MTRTTKTYKQAIEMWRKERETLGRVQPYTAIRGAQKASLFCPWIGSQLLAEIKPAMISDALVCLGTQGGRDGEGLSSATLRAAHLAGTQTFEWAIARGLAKSNPFKMTERPRANYRKSKFLTMEQSQELTGLMARNVRTCMRDGDVRGSSFALATCIALATGMRRGEIFALEWDDVSEQTGRISISKAVKGGGELGLPKSFSGVRNVAIGEGLLKLLLEARDWQETALPPRSWSQTHWIICDKDGEQASLNAFEHWWRTWANENGWEGLRFHELRHTHATLLISSGVDVKTVQLRLGHSSADITMSCYAHAIPLSDCHAASALDSKLFA